MSSKRHRKRRCRVLGPGADFVRAVSGATSLEYAVVGGVLALAVSAAASYGGYGLSDGLDQLKAALSGEQVNKVEGKQLIQATH